MRLIVGKIRAVMPEVMTKLKLAPFPVGHIECQVTASTDGSYFRVHTDRGVSAIDATRQLTYVYYFNREPKGYDGGELRVYDDQIRNDKLARADSFHVVDAAQQQHRVLPFGRHARGDAGAVFRRWNFATAGSP